MHCNVFFPDTVAHFPRVGIAPRATASPRVRLSSTCSDSLDNPMESFGSLSLVLLWALNREGIFSVFPPP